MEERIKELRIRLNKVIVKDLLSLNKAAREIGIHAVALDDFLNGNTKPHMVTTSKIERFLTAKERND